MNENEHVFHADTSVLQPGDLWMEGKNIDQSGHVWRTYEERPKEPQMSRVCWVFRPEKRLGARSV